MRDQLAALSEATCYSHNLVKRVDETIEIFCDGRRIPLALAYSIELGYVETYLEDPATGGLQRDGVAGALKTKRIEGKIEARPNSEDYGSIASNLPRRRACDRRRRVAAARPSRNDLRGGLS